MVLLIMMQLNHAVPRYCGDATGPERLSCDDHWLVVSFFYQVDIGAVRNAIHVPFKTSRWLLVGSVL